MSLLPTALMAIAIVNGIFSPFVFYVAGLWVFWYPTALAAPTASGLFFGASLITATLTLLIAGVPAALCERLGGAAPGTAMAVWLASAGLLSLPGLLRAATFL